MAAFIEPVLGHARIVLQAGLPVATLGVGQDKNPKKRNSWRVPPISEIRSKSITGFALCSKQPAANYPIWPGIDVLSLMTKDPRFFKTPSLAPLLKRQPNRPNPD